MQAERRPAGPFPPVRSNNGAHNPLAPFGGFRQSGPGREYGKFGLEEFLSPQSLQF
jgi:acyl-CoA reductase-like NAD-dependent aldehyde dehydrogenase